MGTWFLATAGGNFLAAKIAQATGGEGASPDQILDVYQRIGWYVIVVGLVAVPVSWLVKRLMHLDTLADDPIAGSREIGEPAAAGMHPAG